MKAFLMHADRDFDLQRNLPPNTETLTQDLELDTLLATMAAGDPFVFEVAKRALLSSLTELDAIVYRQQVLADCLENPTVVRELYELAGAALSADKKVWSIYRDSPRSLLGTSVQKGELLVDFLRRLRELADEHAGDFRSPGFTRFFAMLVGELDEPYLQLIESHLAALNFKGGLLLSAQLGAGGKGKNHMLRRAREQSLLGRVFDRSGYSFTIPDRDDNGFRALGDLEDKGVNEVANTLAQSIEQVVGFFMVLSVEIAFYLGCVNLSETLAARGEPTVFPVALLHRECALSGQGLYDVCLALTIDESVVGNDINADHKSLVMITGANQGGKSTFLRSVGLAQLMTQCGMFVGAESLRVSVYEGLFTHYKREEDASMESGKLDEELARMSQIADQIAPSCVLLCNESFAATNEREGSEIARHVVEALLTEGIKVLFVTHMFDLADSLYREDSNTALFLRAERGLDGARPFTIAEGRPLPTSYGEDSYRKVFGSSVAAAGVAGPADVSQS
jgi:MutS domain V